MIDEKKIYNYIKSQINKYGKPFKGTAYEFGLKIMYYIENRRKVGDWIPCSERLPDTDDYILVSFENYGIPDIARYEANESGGAFYPGDEEESYVSFGLFVNAWQPLPEPYKEG